MKQLLIPFVVFSFISCNQNNKPVGSDYLEKAKEDSAILAREKEVFTGVDSSYLKTVSLSPVEILSYELYSSHINLKTKNKSSKTVDAIKIVGLFYNNFNEPVPSASNHHSEFLSQNTMLPMRSSETISFNIDPEFSSATKVKFYISEVHFSNDSTWNFKNYVK